MKLQPFVSIIILNYNGKDYLKKCLDSVLKTEYPNFEVILVDNSSTDRSLSLAEESFGFDKRLRIIRNSSNLGFSGGNNVGFKHAKGNFIAFLNNDTIVDSNWLTSLVDVMEKDETIGLAQSMLLKIDGQEVQTAGSLLSDYLVLQRILFEDRPSNIKTPSVFETSYACGAAFIIRRELINEIGLFDPKLPFYYDDTLLSFKTWLSGKRVVVVSKSKVCHAKGVNLVWKTYFTSFHSTRAYECLIFDVYFNLKTLFTAIIIFSIVSLNHSLFALRSKNFAVFSANVQASSWVIRNLPWIWANRLKHWSKAKITPAMLLAKFIRINVPTPIYLMPNRIASAYYKNKIEEYERNLMQISVVNET